MGYEEEGTRHRRSCQGKDLNGIRIKRSVFPALATLKPGWEFFSSSLNSGSPTSQLHTQTDLLRCATSFPSYTSRCYAKLR
mmetsp:Transcript_19084/g.39262  ORF Transcript_19084/g.39262 Transcript_19084/m.39262 type:complete len:81 (-) Transcript_19084:91-333(-)